MGLQRISGYKVGGGAFDSITVEKTITVHGDADFDENTLFVDDSENRVGVGTETPQKDLHIKRASGETTLRLESGTFYSDIHQSGRNLFIQCAPADGNIIFYDDSAERMRIDTDGNVGIGNNAPMTALDVVYDYDSEAFDDQLDAGEGGGDVLKLGTGTTVASQLYFLHTDGSWDSADADDVDLGGSQMLGIALGTDPAADGMLVRGFIRIDAAKIAGTPTAGMPCYVSEDTTKAVDFVAPSASDDYVRILGYCLDVDSGNALIYFNPSADVIELA